MLHTHTRTHVICMQLNSARMCVYLFMKGCDAYAQTHTWLVHWQMQHIHTDTVRKSNCKKPWSWSHERNRNSHTHTKALACKPGDGRQQRLRRQRRRRYVNVDCHCNGNGAVCCCCSGCCYYLLHLIWFDLQPRQVFVVVFCFPNLVFACFVFGCDASDSAEGDSSSNGTSHLHL